MKKENLLLVFLFNLSPSFGIFDPDHHHHQQPNAKAFHPPLHVIKAISDSVLHPSRGPLLPNPGPWPTWGPEPGATMPYWFPKRQTLPDLSEHFREIGKIPTTPRSIFHGFGLVPWFPPTDEAAPKRRSPIPTLPPWTMATLAPSETVTSKVNFIFGHVYVFRI